MTDDLATLLDHPERVADVPPERVPALLVQLAAVQTALAARLTSGAPSTLLANDSGGDQLLTAEEVHRQTTVSVRWLYRHANALPFTRRVGRKVLFSSAGLAKWLSTRRP